jgi:hypothetical protein
MKRVDRKGITYIDEARLEDSVERMKARPAKTIIL